MIEFKQIEFMMSKINIIINIIIIIIIKVDAYFAMY